MTGIYERLGVRTIINAKGPSTRLSGGIMRPEVAEAMLAASQHCVDMAELQAGASAVIAEITGAEAGLVTSGAAAGLLLGTAACVTGLDPGRMNRLPDTQGMRNEVVVVRSQRHAYDHAIRGAGVRLVEVGIPDRYSGAGVRDAEAWEIADAITERTAAVHWVAHPRAQPPLEAVVEVARRAGVPVLVDAAAQLPPANNLRMFIAAGADLVAFSGGKAIGGPQASGILCGRRDLIMAAALQNLDLDVFYAQWAPPRAGGERGLGYSYAHETARMLIQSKLAGVVEGGNAMDVPGLWQAMVGAVRNFGRQGIAANAIAAVDVALWDLKARLLGLPLVSLLGACRAAVPVYGSGGFTSYPIDRLQEQLAGWVEQGIGRVKMKVGSQPAEDPVRVRAARAAIGPEAELFVDANGAYDRKQALGFAEKSAEQGVSWFEEPVSSDDLKGLRLIRDRAPAGMDITAGEYGYDLHYFRRMLEAGAVDVLQPDATRCLGVSGFMQAAALCRAHGMPLSAHTAPSIHAHLCCAAETARHIEYFHDHVRIEEMLFDGAQAPRGGELHPDLSRPGLGLELRESEAQRYAV